MNVRALLLILLLTCGISCDTEIYTVDESGSVPVVYCLLNQDDTVQSLRLSRSYLSKNALYPPASDDSLAISGEVSVTIETVEDSQVVSQHKLMPFPISKDSGFFPNDLQWIYKGNFPIRENTSYRMIIEIKEWDYLTFSSIRSLGDFKLVDPAYPEKRKIHLVDDHNPVVHWTRSQNAAVYQVGFRVHYKEYCNEISVEKSIIIHFTTVYYRDDPGSFYSYTLNSNQFYKRLAESIPVDPTVLRQFVGADVFVIAGSESVGFYLLALERQDPFQLFDYKNVINGLGIFGALKTVATEDFKIDDQSLDSLAYGSDTKQLNFLDSDGHRKL